MAFGINNSSQVYGVCDADPDNQRSFFWSDATGYLDLGTVGGSYTSPSGFNDAGLIAGWTIELVKKVTKYAPVLWTVTP